MALTNKKLKEILSKGGVPSENISSVVDEIMVGHNASVDALTEARDSFKEKAEKYDEVVKERDQLKEAVKNDKTDELKKQYDELKAEYEQYRSDVKGKEVQASKSKAYRSLLKEVGVSEKRIDSIMKVTDLSTIDFDDDNKIADTDKVTESIKKEWGDFIPVIEKKGVKVATPPANNGGGTKTKEEIMAIKDTAARQQAIAENHELFGF